MERGLPQMVGVAGQPAATTQEVTPMPLVTPQPDAPVVSTVYLEHGDLRHRRCGAVIGFLGRRQGVELDFYCLRCHEHISLPEYVLARIPATS